MEIGSIILTIVGLSLFEIINSVDNAVINAEVLGHVGPKARRWFLVWGIFIAVFLMRGLLPWFIIYFTNPSLGFIGALTATFSADPAIAASIEESAPVLLVGAAVFLIFLFLHWLFLEPKTYGLHTERFFEKQGVWFYAFVSIILATIVWYSLKRNPLMAFSAVIGSCAFFITHGFKQNAEKVEHDMIHDKGRMSDISKLIYLEVIDATFSIDGVLGSFAFTFSIILILIGNGIGALVVRKLTISNIESVKKYKYLKNGAMYSILFLGVLMLLESFGREIPGFVAPIVTIGVLGYFFYKSKRELKE